MKASLFTIILALTFTEWIGMARITRAQVLKIKRRRICTGIQNDGCRKFFIICKEIPPQYFWTIDHYVYDEYSKCYFL